MNVLPLSVAAQYISTYSLNHGNHAAQRSLQMALSHSAAFHKQAAFNHDSKIRVGRNVWREEQAGYRLYELVLSTQPATIAKDFILASELKQPFTPGQVMGHLKWIYTAGELEVDGKSYVVQAKPEPTKPKVEKPETITLAQIGDTEQGKANAKSWNKVTKAAKPKVEQPKVKAVAARKRTPAKTKKAA
jgi:hypothetical protein